MRQEFYYTYYYICYFLNVLQYIIIILLQS